MLIKKYLKLFIIIIILVWGVFLRFYQLDKQSYWMDEGYTINAIISTINNGQKYGGAILDSGERYFCPLYCFPSAIIFKNFGHLAFNARFLAALAGTSFLFFIYWLGKCFFNNAEILILFFTSFSYWQITWSRQARWYTLLTLFFWIALFFFYKYNYENKNKNRNLVLSLIFTALAIFTHRLAYLLPFIMAGWIIIQNFFCPINNKNKKIIILLLLLLGFFDFVLGFHFLNLLFSRLKLHYNLPYYLSFYLREYFLFVFFSIFYLLETKNKQKAFFWIWPTLIYFFCLSFLTDIVQYRYFFALTPSFYILGSAGIVLGLNKFKSRYFLRKSFFILAIVFIFFILDYGIFWPQKFYFLESDTPPQHKFSMFLRKRPYYVYTPQPNFNKAYEFIKNKKKNKEIIISSYPVFNKIFLNEAGYWLKYDYWGLNNQSKHTKNNKEYYVGARVINNLEELENIIKNKHGYIVFDYMSQDGRIDYAIIDFIIKNTSLVFFDKINYYSQIWVYKF